MTGILLLGLLIGMKHAVEADHVAAVASLATRSSQIGTVVRQGAFWGLGHTLTLFLFGGAVLLSDRLIPEQVAGYLELAVGFMLLLLGGDVLRRLYRDRIHFHAHQHERQRHFHAHSHRQGGAHEADPHQHSHQAGYSIRALLVGMMHGMAGSAALILLVLQTVETPLLGLLYIAIFGVGSIIGMSLLAFAISIPLRYSARSMTWMHNGLHLVVGLGTLALGGSLVYQLGVVGGLLV